MLLWDIFWTFARIGALTFGGGYAMMPMLQREVVEKKKWADEAELMDYYAISQCLPGIIAANTALFVGKKVKGNWGGITAVLGVVFPSIVIIIIIAAFLSNFIDIPAVGYAFAGIRVCVCALILNALVKLWKNAVVDWKTLVIFALVLAGSLFTTLSPILFVVCAAACGVLLQCIGKPKEQP